MKKFDLDRSIWCYLVVFLCTFSALSKPSKADTAQLIFSDEFPVNGSSIEVLCSVPDHLMYNVSALQFRHLSSNRMIFQCSGGCSSTLTCQPGYHDVEQLDANRTGFSWSELSEVDSGRYSCLLTNCAGEEKQSEVVRLLVVARPTEMHISALPQHVYEDSRTSISVSCSANVGETSGWLALKQILANSTEILHPSVNVTNDQKLSVTTDLIVSYSRHARDRDTFVCFADNGYNDSASSDPLIIDVEYPPNEVLLQSPNEEIAIVRESIDRYVANVPCNHAGVVTCSAIANPNPTSTWIVQNELTRAIQIAINGSSVTLAYDELDCNYETETETETVLRCDVTYSTLHTDGPSHALSASLTIRLVPPSSETPSEPTDATTVSVSTTAESSASGHFTSAASSNDPELSSSSSSSSSLSLSSSSSSSWTVFASSTPSVVSASSASLSSTASNHTDDYEAATTFEVTVATDSSSSRIYTSQSVGQSTATASSLRPDASSQVSFVNPELYITLLIVATSLIAVVLVALSLAFVMICKLDRKTDRLEQITKSQNTRATENDRASWSHDDNVYSIEMDCLQSEPVYRLPEQQSDAFSSGSAC